MSKTMTWSETNLPNFNGLKVHVLPGGAYAQVVSLFCQAGAKRAKTLFDAELVVFLGGADVNPSLYGENPVEEVTHWDPVRDRRERAVFEHCRENRIPMFGICRGAQFLHVMNGGTLWQHVDNHAGNHLIYDIEEDVLVLSSSTHHQMMKYNDEMVLLAVTDEPVASFVKNEEEQLEVDSASVIEVEACYYQETRSLCIQGHPEYGPDEFSAWSLHKLQELIMCDWQDVDTEKVLEALA